MTDHSCCICGTEDQRGRVIEPHGWFCTSCKSGYWAYKRSLKNKTRTSKWLKAVL